MRALAVLDPLPAIEPVYDAQRDDFTLLLADQPTTLDQLQAQLDQPASQALSDLETLGAAVDAVGSLFDWLDGTFTTLHASLDGIDYSDVIGEVADVEESFAGSVEGWAPDIGALAAPILNSIFGLFGNFFNNIIVPIEQVLNIIGDAIARLFDAIGQIFSIIFGG